MAAGTERTVKCQLNTHIMKHADRKVWSVCVCIRLSVGTYGNIRDFCGQMRGRNPEGRVASVHRETGMEEM